MSDEDEEVPFTETDREDIQQIKVEQAVHGEKLESVERHLKTVTTNITETVAENRSQLSNHEDRISDTEAEAKSAKRIAGLIAFLITTMVAVFGIVAGARAFGIIL